MSALLAHSVHGSASDQPLVLLHALATSSALWAPQLPAWAAQFRVVAIDLPGHGKSAPQPGISGMADYAEAVKDVLDHLNIDRAAFVGLSLGGMVAQAFALACPQRTSAVVLAHTSARTYPAGWEIWARRLDQFNQDGLVAQIPSVLDRWFPREFAEASPMTLRWIADQIASTYPEGYAAAIRAIQQLDHFDALKTLRAPVLVVAGEVDAAAPPSVATAMSEQIQGARLVVMPGVAHLGNVQQPVLFTETVGDFLRGVLLP
ncbi:MAG: alpha/beta fold hydrolase [Polaromonas sp.]|uniref:alpha/beta fold hydrolase n=1 Tax=Polaromonas sp. TaxID=1869339 RepID=UPI0025F28114|nr:alpha/beta fold hydrolase [Polaromonas sp.]MBI2726162.1 alpha/beta fold hydrolase [Polaromonas sp.]